MAELEKKINAGEQTRKRIPLGTRNVLTAPKKPGFERRFINDVGDRVQTFKDAGWNIVDDGSKIGDDKAGKASLMGSLANPSVGGGQRGVLVEIPEELYKADRAESQAKISQVENELRRNTRADGSKESYGEVKIG